jgi:drug/metabolite transporter (DMT)-like permease
MTAPAVETRSTLSLRADLCLLLVALIWGATFVVVKDALRDASVFAFLFLRFALAAVLLSFFFRTRRSEPARRHPAPWRGGLLCGLLLFAGFALQTAGLRHTSASKSAFLTGLYIVLVPFFHSLVNKSVPRWAELAGIAAATAGTALLSLSGEGWSWNRGDTWTVLCAVAFALQIMALDYWSKRMSVERLSVMQIGCVALFSLLGAGLFETPRVVWSGRLLLALVVTAVFATSLSFTLQTWAQRHTPPTRAALIFASEPMFAGLTGWLAAGEVWTGRMAAGAALILAGILMVELKPGQSGAHQSS